IAKDTVIVQEQVSEKDQAAQIHTMDETLLSCKCEEDTTKDEKIDESQKSGLETNETADLPVHSEEKHLIMRKDQVSSHIMEVETQIKSDKECKHDKESSEKHEEKSQIMATLSLEKTETLPKEDKSDQPEDVKLSISETLTEKEKTKGDILVTGKPDVSLKSDHEPKDKDDKFKIFEPIFEKTDSAVKEAQKQEIQIKEADLPTSTSESTCVTSKSQETIEIYTKDSKPHDLESYSQSSVSLKSELESQVSPTKSLFEQTHLIKADQIIESKHDPTCGEELLLSQHKSVIPAPLDEEAEKSAVERQKQMSLSSSETEDVDYQTDLIDPTQQHRDQL
ncbi:MAG: hypothetical protein ACRC4N_06085, partial [Gammaproteobacteria bacterium]